MSGALRGIVGASAGGAVGGFLGILGFAFALTPLVIVGAAVGGAVLGLGVALIVQVASSILHRHARRPPGPAGPIGPALRSIAIRLWPSDQSWATAAFVALGGVGAGINVGAIVGLTIGVRTHLPTAPVALVEGAFIGIVPGLVVGLLAAAVVLVRAAVRSR
jgi:hypothetical protein